jgi:cathepsin A (carboxypeptidase C)
MAEQVPRCKKMLQKSCIESKDYTECSIALGFCDEVISAPFLQLELNPYDVSKRCTLEELSTTLCYPEM